MITLRDLTEDYRYFLADFFIFKRQDLVLYRLPRRKCFRLSKIELIAAIRFFKLRLWSLGYKDDIIWPCDIYKYKYFELSVFLFGLVNFYAFRIGLKTHDMNIVRLSRLSPSPLRRVLKVVGS